MHAQIQDFSISKAVGEETADKNWVVWRASLRRSGGLLHQEARIKSKVSRSKRNENLTLKVQLLLAVTVAKYNHSKYWQSYA